ncbi:hypothetical protein SY26_06970 [Paracoccus sp. 228]|nr:hypothetical protein SY26_06970 [Paracoccus sp. 228]
MIYHFALGMDLISLQGINANSRTAADDTFKFSGTKVESNSVWYTKSGSDLLILGDVNGDKAADFEIQVAGVSALTANDFWL